MKKYIAVPLACGLLALSGVAANANKSGHSHQKVRVHGSRDTQAPTFNPLEFPLCYVWDFKLHRDVWICGRSAY